MTQYCEWSILAIRSNLGPLNIGLPVKLWDPAPCMLQPVPGHLQHLQILDQNLFFHTFKDGDLWSLIPSDWHSCCLHGVVLCSPGRKEIQAKVRRCQNFTWLRYFMCSVKLESMLVKEFMNWVTNRSTWVRTQLVEGWYYRLIYWYFIVFSGIPF